MMKYFIIVFLLIFSQVTFGQTVGQFRYDTIKFLKSGGYAEFVLKNRTQDTLGYLYNTGSGITEFRSVPPGSPAWGTITGTLSSQSDLNTILNGKQPLDADLTDIAALSPTNNDIIQRITGVWTNRSIAQYKTSLSLNLVENTALSTWAGSTNITTLGTIVAGTWNGSPILSSRGGVPAGGSINQVLKKISGTDYDYSWQADNTGGGATIADGDYGDITFSGTGTIATIDNSAVNSIKIADAAVTNLKLENSTIGFNTPGITGTAPNWAGSSVALGNNAVLNIPPASATGVTMGLVSKTNYDAWQAKADIAGSNTQIQYNNSGVLGASANLIYNGTAFITKTANSGFRFQELTSNDEFYAIYPDGVTPAAANYSFIAKNDGTSTYINGSSASGLAVGGTVSISAIFGGIQVPSLAGFGAGFVAVDNVGLLSWSAGAGGSSYTFTASDFNEAGSTVSIDYTNAQAANGSTKGFLTAADWTTFNTKEPALGNPSTNGYVLSSTTAGTRSWIAPGSGGGGGESLNATLVIGNSTSLPQIWVHDSTSALIRTLQPVNYLIDYTGAGAYVAQRFNETIGHFPGTNASGRPNEVWQFGYNNNSGGGRISTADASYHWAIETHFETGGAKFEDHKQITAMDGAEYRLQSWTINKADGTNTVYFTTNAMYYFLPQSGTPTFAALENGLFDISKIGTGSVQFRMFSEGAGGVLQWTGSILSFANAQDIAWEASRKIQIPKWIQFTTGGAWTGDNVQFQMMGTVDAGKAFQFMDNDANVLVEIKDNNATGPVAALSTFNTSIVLNTTVTDAISINGNNSARASLVVSNANSAGNASVYFQNNRGSFLAYGGLLTGGSTQAGSFLGVTIADRTFLIADGTNSAGLAVGTFTDVPLTFSTNSTKRFEISGSGGITTPGFVSGYLQVDGSGVWSVGAGGSGMTNPMTTAGDIIIGGASGTPTRLAGSATNSYVLTYSTGTNAPVWAAAAAASQTLDDVMNINGTSDVPMVLNSTGTDILTLDGNNAGRSSIILKNAHTTGGASLYTDNNRGSFASYGGMTTFGQTTANSWFEVTRADRTYIIADGANTTGLGVGTLTATPLTLGTNNAKRFEISGTGGITTPGFVSGFLQVDASGIWSSGPAVSGLTANQILFGGGGTLAQSSDFTFNNTTKIFTVAGNIKVVGDGVNALLKLEFGTGAYYTSVDVGGTGEIRHYAATGGFFQTFYSNNILAQSFDISANVTFPTLAGTGTRMVVTDANGELSTQAIPSFTLQQTITAGATLTGNNTITGGAFTLAITSSETANLGAFSATNSSSGAGLIGTSNSGVGTYGISTSGSGGVFISSSSTGIVAESTSGLAGIFSINPSSTNTVPMLLSLQRSSSGTAANGIGMYIDMSVETTDGTNQISNQIRSIWTNATTASRTSSMEFIGTSNAVTDLLLTLAGSGNATLHKGQLTVVTQFTPANSTDAAYPIGTITYDDSFQYYRTSSGTWKKIALATF